MSSEALQQAKSRSGWQAKHVTKMAVVLPADKPGNRLIFSADRNRPQLPAPTRG